MTMFKLQKYTVGVLGVQIFSVDIVCLRKRRRSDTAEHSTYRLLLSIIHQENIPI